MDLKSRNIIGADADRLLQKQHPLECAPDVRSFLDLDLDFFPDRDEDELPALPPDLSDLSCAELRSMCNQMFREMNEDFPRFGPREDYAILCDELRHREGQHFR
ncbi:hypothetical protein [Arthrobacter sp. AET 35A]|uniref:hypothetical protein n=1 Tax=Arthrobacter sp. AET 35A TaxID=2292643 RepID=UPI00177EF329|nr:hypothetical protein [Arthrobacter sp. AET 35A]